jgi:hypothetical protein
VDVMSSISLRLVPTISTALSYSTYLQGCFLMKSLPTVVCKENRMERDYNSANRSFLVHLDQRSRWTIAITWHLSSVVCKLFTFQASPPKPLGKSEPNLAGMFPDFPCTQHFRVRVLFIVEDPIVKYRTAIKLLFI